jgi:hypothetical protein
MMSPAQMKNGSQQDEVAGTVDRVLRGCDQRRRVGDLEKQDGAE